MKSKKMMYICINEIINYKFVFNDLIKRKT